jgi:hypothetical protein
VYFAQVQAKIRLVPGLRASYAMEKEAITARAIQFVPIAMERENGAMACHVCIARVKDFVINTNEKFTMSVDDEVLEIIWQEGGMAHVHRIANKKSWSFDYARSVLYSLGRRDFLDIGLDQVAVLTDKGSKRLEKAKEKRPTLDEIEKAAMDRRMKPYREM